ncbi:MAG: phenylalanine--tRNA ligase subunit beta [Bacteroides sp.]|nr:phenylalanine--tRNA ligase subunit beta [Bacteroides sp.]MBD5339991.1 phenylalanine--tRNA ligase subunit beta [Bacteroides sp.]
MDISYKWLKRFIDFNLNPRELAATLTSLGLECDTVEEVESIRGGLRGVVIGKVLTCEEHPDSDHLHVTTVDLGGEAPVQIVCGAPNVAAGQTVVVATVGTTLYDGDKEFQIKKSKIRGKESFGMICAEDELGLGTDHAGIIVLDEEVKPGTPAAEYFKVESDYRLEVELTPNRVDAASHYGVARDLKAKEWSLICQGEKQGEYPEITIPDVNSFASDKSEGAVIVKIEDEEGCPRYSGVTIRGVEVKESPEWLKNLLISAGQRPINNIVDITNFILLGIGQPLHSFDLDKVKGEEIVVRTCEEGTKFVTLDGVERTLNAADLMICDTEKPLCIAGVFGGEDSGVTESTRNVFIESAWFNPTRVRRTARRHGLSTDASFRYERGADPSITVYAAKLAAVMIKELAGGEICGGLIDVLKEPIAKKELDFSLTYCNNLIGKQLPADLVKCILKALEFDVEETENSDVLHLKVPTYRVDVYRPCDVVEEVLRVYGYNNVEIDSEMHVSLSQRTATDESYDMQQIVSEQLTACGFSEIMNNSLTAVSYYEDSELYPLAECVKLMNPLSNDLGVMRQTLLYGGLESIAHNVNRKMADLKFYEFGNVYKFNAAKEASAEKPLAQYSERMELGIWMTGNKERASWNVKAAEATVYDLRGIVENIFHRLGLADAAWTATQSSNEIFSAKLDIVSRSGKALAEIGLIRSTVLKKFDIEQSVAYASIDWEALFKLTAKNTVTYTELPKTQPVERDLALLVDTSVKFADIDAAIRKAERKLLRDVRLFDVYEGKNLPAGKKSYAVKMTLQDTEKTLNDKQIESAMNRIITALKALGAELR